MYINCNCHVSQHNTLHKYICILYFTCPPVGLLTTHLLLVTPCLSSLTVLEGEWSRVGSTSRAVEKLEPVLSVISMRSESEKEGHSARSSADCPVLPWRRWSHTCSQWQQLHRREAAVSYYIHTYISMHGIFHHLYTFSYYRSFIAYSYVNSFCPKNFV